MTGERAPNFRAAQHALSLIDQEGFLAGIDLLFDQFAAPEIEFKSILAASVEGQTEFRGREEIRRYWAEFVRLFDFQVEDAEVWADDADRLVVISARLRGAARGSGMPLDQQVALLFKFTDGKVVQVTSYLSPDEAIAAAQELARA